MRTCRHAIRRCGRVLELNLEASALNKEITALCRSHEWRRSLSLLDEALAKNASVSVVSFGAALAACDRGSFWQEALRLLSEASPYGLNAILWNATISACSRARQWEYSCRLLEEMDESQVKPDTISFNSTMRSFTGTGSSTSRWQRGMKLHQELLHKGLHPSPKTLSTITTLCAQGNAWPFALSFLKDALEASTVLDAASITSVLVSCARSRRWQRSVQLFAELTSRESITPDLACFNAAMSACERGGHWSGAIALFNDMQIMLLQPDLTSVNAVISACEKGCNWQFALLVAATHSAPASKSTVTFAALLSSLMHCAAWQLAIRVLDDMREQNMQPGPLHVASVLEACTSPRSPDPPNPSISFSVLVDLNSSVLQALNQRKDLSEAFEPDSDSLRVRCQEITKSAVAGLEALLRAKRKPQHKNALNMTETLQLFEEVIYQPVLSSLANLASESSDSIGSIPSDVRLEEQYGLGPYFTGQALVDLGFPWPGRSWWHRAEKAALRVLKRKFMQQSTALPERALARKLLVWSAYDLQSPLSDDIVRLQMEGRPTFAQGVGQQRLIQVEEVPLSPIFVEHDRANHAERWALLSILSDLLAKGVQPCDFQSIQGDVWLYGVHTPCISCMAIFCQFRNAFPQVSLRIAFRDWSDTRQALQKELQRHGFEFGTSSGLSLLVENLYGIGLHSRKMYNVENALESASKSPSLFVPA